MVEQKIRRDLWAEKIRCNLMTRNMYINVSDSFTRVAIVDNNQLSEVYIEGKSRKRLVGNIYLGRVTNVLAGIQAAFVDIGLKRDAFLYIHDIIDPSADDLVTPKEHDDDSTDTDHESDLDSGLAGTAEAIAESISEKSIHEMVQPGQKIMVQITREPMEMKGARVTTHITLPGRYLVLMASSDHIGVSKRIESDDERIRLKQILQDLRPEDSGLIVRTAAEGKSYDEFSSDVIYLSKLWQSIRHESDLSSPPSLIYHDLDTISRVMRDLFDDSFDRILIDSEEDFASCKKFVNAFAPELIDRIQLYSKSTALFKRYNLEEDLKLAIERRVPLPSGGYLIFDETEAMMVVDVNTGRYAGKHNLEETVLKTNLEAAEVIAKQVRLRDIGGIIVIDFIDMEVPDNRDSVVKQLQKSFEADRSKVNISHFTEMGLVEMTRKRLKRSLSRTLLQNCPHCNGSGKVLHPQTIAASITEKLKNIIPVAQANNIKIVVHPTVKAYLKNSWSIIEDHFHSLGLEAFLQDDDRIIRHQHQITWF